MEMEGTPRIGGFDPRSCQTFRPKEKIKSFAIIYLVDVKEVPDFNTMYEPARLAFLCTETKSMVCLPAGEALGFHWVLMSGLLHLQTTNPNHPGVARI